MSIWQTKPDQSTKAENFRIYRTPVGKEVELICLGGQFLGVKLHYWKGRSTPCMGPDCEACQQGHKPRWKGYIQCLHPATKTVLIYEFTERGYEPFEAARRQFSHLRGMRFRCFRLNRKVNGPIQIVFADLREESPHLPEPCDLAPMLERMWEIRQQTFTFQEKEAAAKLPLNGRSDA